MFRRRTTRHTAWIWVDRERSTTAAVVPQMVELSTQLTDGTFVETMYPVGHNDSQPGLELRHVPTSLVDAQRAHQNAIAVHALHHGDARAVDTMSTFLREDAEFRQRHALVVLRRPFVQQQLVPALLAGCVGVFFLALTVWPGLLA
jgi:hypothetical protein